MPKQSSSSADKVTAHESVFADRYVLGKALGAGGMADVNVAFDPVRKRNVALKRLRIEEGDEHGAYSRSLFEREFHVLSELAHPRVVDAYDYGVVDGVPYYTMELLDGGDLRDLSPLPYKRACSVFRDVCSVLALLHSRRLIYRDLNVRNVRCTEQGIAKLIDFGAMMPMGHPRMILGTPGFVAPEIVYMQAVDGRSDLYALGCALYYALTGRAAHPARDFIELCTMWSKPPPPPSHYLAGIPAKLDELVIDLLHQDPALRPANAAEVMDRLAAIGELEEDKSLQVSGAYLVTPPLIGRGKTLEKVRRLLVDAGAGRGRVVLFESGAGAGHTRMLDACVMEGRLSGAVVARASAADGQYGEYGVARWLASQLIDAMPNAIALAAQKAAILGHILPKVREVYPDVELMHFADPRDRRPVIQAALREWLIALSQERTIALAIDDVHLVDEPTVALLALLTDVAESHALCLLLTTQGGAESTAEAALRVLRGCARAFHLPPLNERQTHELVTATFGDSPQAQLLSDRLFQASGGRPRDIMQLAQYLVAQDIVRYQAGEWMLPNELDVCDLPISADDVSARTVAALSPAARRLACSFALSKINTLSFDDCLYIAPDCDQGTLLRVIAELVTADVVQMVDGFYALSRANWEKVLLAAVDAQEQQRCHEKLAAMVKDGGHNGLLHIHHLRFAGQTDAALDAMVAYSGASLAQTENSPDAFQRLIESLPKGWYELFNWAIETAESKKRPPLGIYTMRFRLSGVLGLNPQTGPEHFEALFAQLAHDIGLDIYEELAGKGLEPGERLKAALEGAQARFVATAEDERVQAPFFALRPLARTEITAASVVVGSYDARLLHGMPSLKPLEALSPALGAVDLLIEGLRHRMAGRSEMTQQVYGELLQRLAQPDRSGVDPTHAKYMRLGVLNGLAMLDVAMGRERALRHASSLHEALAMRPNANHIRMLNHYFHAQPKDGDALKHAHILKRIESTGIEWFEGSQLMTEAVAHSAAEDLPRLRGTLAEIEFCARDHAGWAPILSYARGECHRLRGDLEPAEEVFATELLRCSAGQHQIWVHLASAHIRTLTALGRAEEARALGANYLKAARGEELGINEIFIRIPLAAAQSQSWQVEEARANIDEVIAMLPEQGITGLFAGLAHEASARVAIDEGNHKQARAEIRICGTHVRADLNRSGHARCERLREELGRVGARESLPPMAASGTSVMRSELHSRLVQAMADSEDSEQLGRRALQFLVAESRASGGALYVNVNGELKLAATINVGDDIDRMEAWAVQQFAVETQKHSDAERAPMDTCERKKAVPGDQPSDLSEERLMLYSSIVLWHRDGDKRRHSGIAVLLPGQRGLSDVTQTLSELLSRELSSNSKARDGATRVL